jgi:glycosyltransferase involved in cell wall biosynthesis
VDATTVPLGVDHRIFSKDPAAGRRIRKELGLEDRFVMITAGRLERAKRIEAFIRALKLIDSDDAAMIVVGQGDESYLEYLRSVSDDRVVFLGFRRPDELAALYSAADLGVWGKASITIREAMSCSLPLLLFDTGDMRSLIKWDNGIAVERDPKRIKDIMLELMEDVDLRKKLGDNGRKAVEEDLSVEAEAKRLLEIYRG